jgi:uncharacterized protein
MTKAVRARAWLAAVAAALLAMAPAVRANPPDPVRFGIIVESGDLRAVQAWLDAGLDPQFLADRIGTGLMIGAWEGNIPMMALFLSYGARISATNKVGETALMHAAWKGHVDAVKWLLDRRARINNEGLEWSALHYAVFAGQEDVARLLIERGADVNARSTNGSSILMMAAREGRDGLAKVLLGAGADPRVTNDHGEDAFVWAMRHGHASIAKAVGTPERFAAAARSPESFGPRVRSNPVPSRLDELIKEMRAAEASGRFTPELQMAYLLAVRDLRRTAETTRDARQGVPQAMEITARRAEPGQESAVIFYQSDRPQTFVPAAAR